MQITVIFQVTVMLMVHFVNEMTFVALENDVPLIVAKPDPSRCHFSVTFDHFSVKHIAI
jgi:hypothetical protein